MLVSPNNGEAAERRYLGHRRVVNPNPNPKVVQVEANKEDRYSTSSPDPNNRNDELPLFTIVPVSHSCRAEAIRFRGQGLSVQRAGYRSELHRLRYRYQPYLLYGLLVRSRCCGCHRAIQHAELRRPLSGCGYHRTVQEASDQQHPQEHEEATAEKKKAGKTWGQKVSKSLPLAKRIVGWARACGSTCPHCCVGWRREHFVLEHGMHAPKKSTWAVLPTKRGKNDNLAPTFGGHPLLHRPTLIIAFTQ